MAPANFLSYLQFEKRYSPHTIIAYRTDLEQFFDYLKESYSIEQIQEVNYQLIRSWIVSLIEMSINPRSVNRKITTLKTFYKFLLREKIIMENPMLKVQSLKTSRRLPLFVEKDKMDFLLDEVNFGVGFPAIRNKLIMEMFYSTGIRLSELIHLAQSNIDFHHCTIKVLGKRNKERIIPFNDNLKRLIETYIALKKTLEIDNDFLFTSEKGKKMNEKSIYRLVKVYLDTVTTLTKKSPHVLRHTFATHMLNNGADLNAIKELLGHTSLSATQIYTHNTVEKLKNIYKLAHPKA